MMVEITNKVDMMFMNAAITARALVGMVHKVGTSRFLFAYHMYSRNDEKGWEESKAFKKAFSIRAVDIEFVGVWDTVNAVGIIPKRLPFTRANDGIKYFRHALSLDERRVMRTFAGSLTLESRTLRRSGLLDIIAVRPLRWVKYSTNHVADVGGGPVANNTRNNLVRIPLRWMIREIFKAGVGILFKWDMFKDIGMDPATLYPYVVKRPDIVYHKSPLTALRIRRHKARLKSLILQTFIMIFPVHGQLRNVWGWWILEVTPQPVYYQDDSDNSDVIKHTVNWGDGCDVPRQHIDSVKVHRSVKIRIGADFLEGGEYSPNAKVEVDPE
ncbi:hypothetical protein M405DRAFT_882037 [Rhizopogon salebrosus TDB-379]|nr:hypothetical protein M405DRAFT_882037 [Rhizopogon salebrosus TDB-379]